MSSGDSTIWGFLNLVAYHEDVSQGVGLQPPAASRSIGGTDGRRSRPTTSNLTDGVGGVQGTNFATTLSLGRSDVDGFVD